MDVDAVVRRAPELALIDELAHTNVPEARNEKRWQDIDEVLAAGNRRDLDRQHPAPREPERRDRRAHRRSRARDVPRPGARGCRRGRARRPDARGPAGAAAGRQGLLARARGSGARQLLPDRPPVGAAGARAAGGRRGRRSAPPGCRARPAQRAGRGGARARARHARTEVAADPPPRLALGRAPRRAARRALGTARAATS